MGDTCEAVISAYEGFLKDCKMINQTSALQLMFDLRFVQTLLLLRDNKVRNHLGFTVYMALQSEWSSFFY